MNSARPYKVYDKNSPNTAHGDEVSVFDVDRDETISEISFQTPRQNPSFPNVNPPSARSYASSRHENSTIASPKSSYVQKSRFRNFNSSSKKYTGTNEKSLPFVDGSHYLDSPVTSLSSVETTSTVTFLPDHRNGVRNSGQAKGGQNKGKRQRQRRGKLKNVLYPTETSSQFPLQTDIGSAASPSEYHQADTLSQDSMQSRAYKEIISENHGSILPIEEENQPGAEEAVRHAMPSQKKTTSAVMGSLLDILMEDDTTGRLRSVVDLTRHAREGGRQVTNPLVQEVCSTVPDLMSINLTGAGLITDAALWSIARHCPRLRALSIYGCTSLTNVGLRAISLRCSELERLDLGGCPQWDDQSMRVLGSGCWNLRRLSLDNCDALTGHGLAYALSCAPLLRSLSARSCARLGGDRSDAALVGIGSRCAKLAELDLIGCQYAGDRGVLALLRGCGPRDLEVLRLGGCEALTLSSFQAIAKYCGAGAGTGTGTGTQNSAKLKGKRRRGSQASASSSTTPIRGRGQGRRGIGGHQRGRSADIGSATLVMSSSFPHLPSLHNLAPEAANTVAIFNSSGADHRHGSGSSGGGGGGSCVGGMYVRSSSTAVYSQMVAGGDPHNTASTAPGVIAGGETIQARFGPSLAPIGATAERGGKQKQPHSTGIGVGIGVCIGVRKASILTELTLNGLSDKVGDKEAALVAASLGQSLRTVNLSGSGIGARGVRALVLGCPKLARLVLVGCQSITDNALRAIAGLLADDAADLSTSTSTSTPTASTATGTHPGTSGADSDSGAAGSAASSGVDKKPGGGASSIPARTDRHYYPINTRSARELAAVDLSRCYSITMAGVSDLVRGSWLLTEIRLNGLAGAIPVPFLAHLCGGGTYLSYREVANNNALARPGGNGGNGGGKRKGVGAGRGAGVGVGGGVGMASAAMALSKLSSRWHGLETVPNLQDRIVECRIEIDRLRAVLALQRVFRGHCGRKEAELLATRRTAEHRVTYIQALLRGFLVRKMVHVRLRLARHRLAAIKIQATFRGWAQRSRYRSYLCVKQAELVGGSMVVRIQTVYRGYRARKYVRDHVRRAYEEGALARVKAEVETERAVRLIQRWARGVQGRAVASVLRHQRGEAERMVRLIELSTRLVQRLCRGYFGRKEARRRLKVREAEERRWQASTVIQRFCRAYIARRVVRAARARNLARQGHHAALVIQSQWRGARDRYYASVSRALRSLIQVEVQCATRVQAVWRGVCTRRAAHQLRLLNAQRAIEQAAAVHIQRVLRGHLGRTLACGRRAGVEARALAAPLLVRLHGLNGDIARIQAEVAESRAREEVATAKMEAVTTELERVSDTIALGHTHYDTAIVTGAMVRYDPDALYQDLQQIAKHRSREVALVMKEREGLEARLPRVQREVRGVKIELYPLQRGAEVRAMEERSAQLREGHYRNWMAAARVQALFRGLYARSVVKAWKRKWAKKEADGAGRGYGQGRGWGQGVEEQGAEAAAGAGTVEVDVISRWRAAFDHAAPAWYYYNVVTGHTTWEQPLSVALDAALDECRHRKHQRRAEEISEALAYYAAETGQDQDGGDGDGDGDGYGDGGGHGNGDGYGDGKDYGNDYGNGNGDGAGYDGMAFEGGR